ncbi:hypothetical protein KFE25_012638 [Diacronema lutheri]|uniref:Thioredoxin domain-containing protein n=1 Tax=Diacronema lutheri TaxID=2081491 RepID=A0A7R9UZJ7_DIALT|nr:hypothetical protein KFE25_012638 [Diacronema lutheri]|mmetsp:Transcript_797/g.2482  ORF Transcript_797/g.2482 Transcript_797/m.2482 type:complete len:202 (+) Transcript_797:45-650(+)
MSLGPLLLTAALGFGRPVVRWGVAASVRCSRAAPSSSASVGAKLPDVTLFEGQPEFAKAAERSLAELTRGKTAVIFAVPGAFTPGCSVSHLPSFIERYDDLKNAGVDMVICTATNDPYVMEAWGRASGVARGTILMLSDKEAKLCRALGVATESDVMVRSERYALIAKDGVISAWLPAAMPGGEKKSENTYAPSVLAALRG